MKKFRSYLPNLPHNGKEIDYLSIGIAVFVIILISLQGLISERYNNYLIFENTTRNLLNQLPMYGQNSYHGDSNHYGIIFSILFMPFYVFPPYIGLFIWNFATSFVLYLALCTLPFKKQRTFYLIAISCFVSSLLSEQFNPISAAFIILSYTLINREKGIWAALFIMLGAFIKIYGLVGLLFFFFSKSKSRFTLYIMGWAVVLFFLPMLFSSFDYVMDTYQLWGRALSAKSLSNLFPESVNVSIHHFARTFLPNLAYRVTFFVGALLVVSPFIRLDLYRSKRFQLLALAAILIYIPLFSSGSEDCTYIIAAPGIALWYMLTPKRNWKIWLTVALVIFSTSKIPDALLLITNRVELPFSIMSLPYFLIFLHLLWTVFTITKPSLYGRESSK